MTYIEEYCKFLKKNPDKACHKVLITYKKLVDDIKKPKQVSFFNEITEENETHTYIFNENKGRKILIPKVKILQYLTDVVFYNFIKRLFRNIPKQYRQ